MATNDDMRQQFLNMYVPKIWDLGLTVPDTNLKKNEDPDNKSGGKWDYTEPDWDEFKRVINGGGPCNAERLAVRRMAEERGRWVRQALMNKNESYVMPLA